MSRARVWILAAGKRSPGSFSDPSSLRRHGVSNLNALRPKTPTEPHKTFKSYEPGYLHVDVKYLPQMADETTRRYLFVAIDRATR